MPNPVPLTGPLSLLTSWTWDAAAVGLTALLTAAYLLTVVNVRRRGLGWPAGRTWSWCIGNACFLLVTVGGLGAYAHALFWVFMIQILALLLAVPVLLAYGRPLALAAGALPPNASARLLAAATGPSVSVLTNPLVGPLLVPLALSAIVFTPVFQLVMVHAWAYQVLQVALTLLGLFVAIGLVGDGTERQSSLALAAAAAAGLLELVLDAIPGIVLRLRTHLVATSYWGGPHRRWGPSPLRDQQHAGAVLWFVAEAADLPFLFIVTRRWIRVDDREARRVDREMDVVDRQAEEEDRLVRPWWETDPSRPGGHRLAHGGNDDEQ